MVAPMSTPYSDFISLLRKAFQAHHAADMHDPRAYVAGSIERWDELRCEQHDAIVRLVDHVQQHGDVIKCLATPCDAVVQESDVYDPHCIPTMEVLADHDAGKTADEIAEARHLDPTSVKGFLGYALKVRTSP